MSDAVKALDEHFVRAVQKQAESRETSPNHPDSAPEHANEPAFVPDAAELLALFRAQATSRHLDFAARWLQTKGSGFYTISSAGHEANAAVGLLSEVTDPALLHYRSGALYIARANRAGRAEGARDVLLGVAAAEEDPISGGRHKVIGNRELHVVPQTSTIASHLPRAVGLGFALGLARDLSTETEWADDSVVLCSFGDASANHSTAVGALNAAAYLTHRGIACPVLFVCEDNGIGISTPSPSGWTARQLSSVPGIEYFAVDGSDPLSLLEVTRTALAHVRSTRSPAMLHVKTVRFLGHAGSDVESAYRSSAEIAADYDRDPLLGTARALIDAGTLTPDEVVAEYRAIGERVMAEAASLVDAPRLTTREAVIAPLEYPGAAEFSGTSANSATENSPALGGLTLAQAINAALAAALDEHPNTLIFGEDVGRKGGVYGVTRGLQKRFGRRRVFDTLLDEQTILGTALGTALAGFLPIPEIQYLAYLHNAEDQLRGEAASLAFFSNGQYTNGMVVRIAGLAYQKGFGGHFHNDNSLAVLRDIPGIIIAVPSNPADAAGMLRTCIDLARDGRVCAFVEPIALYHSRDLEPGDDQWLASVDPSARVPLGEIASYGEGGELLIVTYGNGVPMSLRAANALSKEGIRARVVDLRWLLPLPTVQLAAEAKAASCILIVDETRGNASLGDAIRSAVTDANPNARVAVVSAADTFIPLGSASGTVLVQEPEIVAAAHTLLADN